MALFASSSTQLAGGQIALAAVLALAGFYLLLPRPRRQTYWTGGVLLIAAAVVFGVRLSTTFGKPMPDLVGTVMFALFSLGALGFGTVLVVQHNPARGAIAFAFVILSTCGLFLLLAAPFLMAATIIIYAGAIIVTFLFVLMLSHPRGASNENDRSREPLFGALAGFAFVGLVLFALYLTALGKGEVMGVSETAKDMLPVMLPSPELTSKERAELADAIESLNTVDERLSGNLSVDISQRLDYFDELERSLERIVGISSEVPTTVEYDPPLRKRLEKSPGKAGAGAVLYREDQQTRAFLTRVETIRNLNWKAYKSLEVLLIEKKGDLAAVKNDYRRLREEVVLLRGSVELPARNVENLGYLLYADHLLAIELAGTLLLVATIGAVAIAHRKLDKGVAA